MWGTGIFYGLWLNSFPGDTSGINVSCGRQDSLIKVAFPCVGILLKQRKRGLRVVKTIHFEEGGKRKQKNYFSESTQNGKVKLMFLKLIFIYLWISHMLSTVSLLGIWMMANRYPVECWSQGHKSSWDFVKQNRYQALHFCIRPSFYSSRPAEVVNSASMSVWISLCLQVCGLFSGTV